MSPLCVQEFNGNFNGNSGAGIQDFAELQRLETLPYDIIYEIVLRLNFNNICSLRLVSRKISLLVEEGTMC